MKIKPLKLGSFEVEYPFTIPSGIVTTTADTIYRIADDIPEIGIITTKSIGPCKRGGNLEPVLEQIKPDTFLNAVGLANPGYDEFAEELKDLYPLPKNKFLLTSIFGKDEEEFVEISKKLALISNGLELNFSCPHASGYGMFIGQSPELTEKITKAVRKAVDIPVAVKLTPNVSNMGEIAKAAARGGADAIVAINTLGPYESKILTNKKGGMSGGGIKNVGTAYVYQIRRAVDLPIIAMGGISSAENVRFYESVGANGFGIGSALIGMNTEQIKN